ncbi:PREDICTED: pre-mRNA 3' end processing protein WDR33 isoform X2 [Dipodomys ordii]|uniref:Pre-mRNA 3' end processing protein WDR33 isoform X2 n=1 Tax=Dipodomys ordii TaxID=10020 RepID=A0A1S3G7Q9_DIPOR|nr:PREDICTED: pre-mRNA 3' end processing protein WDR33 isoform X2 [Dipodomys ordii]XP_042541035.1 pre-mRNA 3' end processing protein WDR33 isoform X2 [Dipodomys spectabilis]
MATEIGSPPRFFHMPRFQHQAPRQLFYKRPDFAQQQAMQQLTFDGKRMRKAVNRKTIDYNPSVIKYLENRIWQRDQRDMRAIQPDAGYYNDLVPPIGMLSNPMNAVTTKFVRTSTNKVKCPVFVVRWTPEGRRLVTGASSGEFTLWNGLTFNFETILQAHDSPVRAMTWSHNDMWMLTADHGGYVKYWQSNMNNVKMFQAHKEAIREARFIHNIPFSVVPIVMVKLFSKCILGAEMHGLCQVLGSFLHPINTVFFFVCTHSPFCWHLSEVVCSGYQPLQCVRDVLSATFCTGFLFIFMVNNVYTLLLFIYCVRQEYFIPNKAFSL